jgi:hypothetical protein
MWRIILQGHTYWEMAGDALHRENVLAHMSFTLFGYIYI